MTEHDVLVGFRLRLFTLAEELGNVSAACRRKGVDRSTYYRWKHKVDRWGLELCACQSAAARACPTRSVPISSSESSPSASATPRSARGGSPPSLRPKWGGLRIFRARRLARLVSGGPQYPQQAPGAHRPPARPLRASTRSSAPRAPHRGRRARREDSARLLIRRRLQGTKGTVWQYTAIDVASAYAWAELHASPHKPRARHTRELVHRVARELKMAGWRPGRGHDRQGL